ncbi:streptophobe family protein [Streptomyces sp. NPDC059786]|uniref:streptophobe family protein n=1 Tax=Streptomyces sp. NPDC059786 TaxID=3346946 RepID=UPI0036664BAC
MTRHAPPDQARRTARPGWLQALATVLAGAVAMGAVAALGLWAAGADGLPGHVFAGTVAATVVTAAGGGLDVSADAGPLADTRAGLTAMPLSVTLAGALVIGAGFLRPLRHRPLTGGRALAGWAARIAVCWLAALTGLAYGARQDFAVPLGGGTLADLGGLFGVSPRAGFRADVPVTLLCGLGWLAVVLVLALLVSRGTPLPARLGRYRRPVRPAAAAMVALLLGSVVIGLVVGLVVAATRGHAAQTFAVLLLGLPNLVWLALTIGLGASWEGRVDGPFGLPVPHLLDQVLRAPDLSTLDLRTLAEYDARVWWLPVVDAVLLPAAAYWAARRSPAGTRPWQHAVRLALALALMVLLICLLARIDTHYTLSLPIFGDLNGALSGRLVLHPHVWTTLGFAVLWGLVTGFLGALATGRSGSAP